MRRAFLLLVIPALAGAGSLLNVPGKKMDDADRVSINRNFQTIENDQSNLVHKTQEETITGAKTFSTLTASTATITTLTVTNLVSTYPLGMKNYVINGDMRIDQRNVGAAVTVSTSAFPYTVDRFFGSATGAAVTMQRVSAGITGFPYALRVTGAASNATASVSQRVESLNIAHAHGQSLTCSFWLAASNATSIELRTSYPSAVDNYTSVTDTSIATFTVTSTLTRYSYTIATPDTTNGLQIVLKVNTGLGASQTMTTTGWQLELGDTATAFEYRLVGQEFALCQQYFQKSYANSIVPGTASSLPGRSLGYTVTVNDFYSLGQEWLSVSMRAIPTVVLYNYATGATGTLYDASDTTSDAAAASNINERRFRVTSAGGSLTAGHYYYWHWTASSEL